VIAAALTYLSAGRVEQAQNIADELANQMQPHSRAYDMMLNGMIASMQGRHVEAIEAMTEAIALADLWLLRFSLGKAYLAAGYQAEAIGEFMICKGRHCEATSFF
jgi:predicted Zn-dependent protease